MPTEEQTQYNNWISQYGTTNSRAAQRLTISNRTVAKLGFWLCKFNSPTGNVTFTARKVSDDSVILSKVWGDASALPVTYTYEEVTFDSPALINQEVRICCEFSGGNSSNYVKCAMQDTDVKANEYTDRYSGGYWRGDTPTYDTAYRYTYNFLGGASKSDNVARKLAAIGAI